MTSRSRGSGSDLQEHGWRACWWEFWGRSCALQMAGRSMGRLRARLALAPAGSQAPVPANRRGLDWQQGGAHLQASAAGVGGRSAGALVLVHLRGQGGDLGLQLLHLSVHVAHVAEQAEVDVLARLELRQAGLHALRACTSPAPLAACCKAAALAVGHDRMQSSHCR